MQSIRIKWTRRDKRGQIFMSGVDMPLSEAKLQYQVQILTADSFPLLKRTLLCHKEECLYPASMIQADFGSMPDAITVIVAQMSAVVGAGTPATIVLDLT